MVAIHFGNLCFNDSQSEQIILLVLDSKKNHSSIDDFVTKALKYLESREDFWDN